MRKKLLSAVIRLAIGLVAVTLVSYWWFSDAWFSENRAVKTDGITLSAIVPLNMYISGSEDARLNQSLTFPMSQLNELGFANTYDLSSNIVLRPVSSSDGKTFWYAKKVNPAGEAVEDLPSQSTYSMVLPSDSSYYKEKTVYIATTTQAYDDIVSLDCFVSQVTIEGISSNQLYKAARISITAVDDEQNETTIIYRYAANAADTEGQALPAYDAHSNVLTDPSITMGSFVALQSGALPINLKCAQNGNVSVKAITVRMWFEGENSFAVRTLAGGGFTFDIRFTLVDPALGD